MAYEIGVSLASWSRRGVLLGGVFLLVGCLSPTLPLPPPSRPLVSSPDSAGFVHIQGRVRPEATAYTKNIRTGGIVGQVTDETGQYEYEIAGEVGDRLVIWYTVALEPSMSVEVLVPAQDPPNNVGGAGGAGE